MQPLKSICAAVVVAPGVTLIELLLVLCDGIEHIGAPDAGFVASASTV